MIAWTAGCVVASRLSENPAVRVALFEAGGYGDQVTVSGGLNFIFGDADAAKVTGFALPSNAGTISPELGSANVTLGSGTNFLYLAGLGNDVFSNGGKDNIQSGAGHDLFTVSHAGGVIDIANFGLSDGDQINLSAILGSDAAANLAALGLSTLTHASAFGTNAPVTDTLLKVTYGGATTLIYLENMSGQSLNGLISHGSLVL